MLYQQVKSVLEIPRHTVYSLIIYSLLLGFLSLTIPVSVQTLVNLVGVSLSIRPMISLITILTVLLSAAFFVRIFQLKLIEEIQRKLFVNIVVSIAVCVYKVDFKDLMIVNIREKINRAFELKVIQKSVAIIFIILLDIFLQTLVCVIMLGFYHPMFLIFDIMLVSCIFIAIFLPLKSGYEAALSESGVRYDIVSFFEEKTAEYMSFKQRPISRSIAKVDAKLCDYLDKRTSFFSVMLRQHIYIGLTYIFMNILLLGIGSYLIINGQLSIGQLIAAEILVNTVLLGLLKFSQYLNDCYDFLVGTRKILDLLEVSKKKKQINNEHKSAELEEDIERLDIKVSDGQKYSINFIESKFNELTLSAEVAQTFLNSFFDDNAEEVIRINEVCLRNYHKEAVSESIHIASGIEIVSGTILDNLCESNYTQEKLKYLSELLNMLEISFLEKDFEKGMDSQTIKYNLEFDTMVVLKMNVIRAILKDPKLLILIDSYGLTNRSKGITIKQILEKLEIPTLIISMQ